MTLPFRLFDRYVTGIFIRQLIFALLAAVLIFLVVDLIEKLDKFIDRDTDFNVILKYYAYYLPYIVYLMLPVAVLLATLFTVGSLNRSHELTAMKASGMGLHRILFHLLFLGVLLSGWNFVFGETLVPYSNKISKDIYLYQIKKISKDSAARTGNIYLHIYPGQFVYVKHYDAAKQTIFDLDRQWYWDEVMLRRLFAERAVWRDSAWVLENAEEWIFEADATILHSYYDRSFGDLGFFPADLLKVQTNPEEMGYWQLDGFVKRLRDIGGDPVKWSVELAFKISTPWTCAIVILLGLPIAAHYRRSGVTLSFGIGLFLSFAYFGLQQFGKILGFSGVISPHFAAWVGNTVFLSLGLFLYLKAKK